MFVTADQLLAHAVGDYVIQSDWMASEKTKKNVAALAHALTYTLPFLLLTTSGLALLVICGTHFIIDRWRLARYVCWAKNWIGLPRREPAKVGENGLVVSPETWVLPNRPWAECRGTGYSPQKPDWLAVWLLIIADNVMHVACNGAALKWLV